MTRTATRLFITLALGAGAATMASAQMGPGSSSPLPGTGDSTKISQGNQQNNAEYNRLIGAADPKASSSKVEQRASKHQSAVAATASDITAGAALRDSKGVSIGTIASLDADGVVVDTGQTKIKVPLMAFGKDDQGLLLGITAAKFAELVSKAQAPH